MKRYFESGIIVHKELKIMTKEECEKIGIGFYNNHPHYFTNCRGNNHWWSETFPSQLSKTWKRVTCKNCLRTKK